MLLGSPDADLGLMSETAAAAWQAKSDGLAADVFADDVPNSDQKA